jgi:hypothetical protein
MQEKPFEYAHLPHYLSLGAGVQSSTLALMYAVGELTPMPKAAIFADTQAEPASVYKWLDWLEKQLPFPVHRVTFRDLQAEALTMRVTKDGRKFSRSDIPLYTLNTKTGAKGAVPNRSCTRDYKIRPINKFLRKEAGVKRGEKEPQCVSIVGISLDEIRRMKPSRDPWVTLRWPLIEKRIDRRQCKDWMESHGYPEPPRSACVFCPYHANSEWRRLQVEEPEEFERAVKFEKDLQAAKDAGDNFYSVPFLHNSCKPLDTIDFRSDVERGQGLLWDDECEGMCGI